MTKELEYIRDISYLIMENYSDKEPLTEEKKASKKCFLRYCNEIKQALIKAQEQEKVLKILFEKNVTIFWLKECKSLEEYNYNTADYMKLTQEEFDLLKRWIEND